MNRRWANIVFLAAGWGAGSLCAALLLFLLGVIVWQGAAAINLDFLLTASRNFGSEGGIFYQIIGSLLLVVCAGLLSFSLGLGCAIFKSEYMGRPLLRKLGELLIFGLNGVPSIVFGIFGLVFFVHYLGTGISWFVGSIILSIMILPTVVLAAFQSIESIPSVYRETALALGMSRWQVVTHVLLPQGLSGAITGLLMGLARAAGETAPIMFIATAYSGVELPASLFTPVTALPTHILALAQQAVDPRALRNAWGASLVLLGLVMVLSVSAFLARTRLKGVSVR